MRAPLFAVYSLLLAACFSCKSNDDGTFISTCDDLAVVNSDEFENAESTLFEFISAEISGNCLQVKFSAPGCDGSSSTMKLIDSGVIKESFPIQRDLRLVLDNNEACLAVFTKELSFDLSPLKTPNDNVIQLNLEGRQYIYSY